MDDILKGKKVRVLSNILLVIAALLFAYFIWSVIYCSTVLASNFQNGLTFKDHVYQIFDFYMQNSLGHLFDSVIIAALGVILRGWAASGKLAAQAPAAPAGDWSPFEMPDEAPEIKTGVEEAYGEGIEDDKEGKIL